MMIKLMIADDHPIVREGLKRIATECPDMEVVSEAADGHELVEQLRSTAVDVLLLDISMPGPEFLELMRRLRDDWPKTRVLVLSTYPEDRYAVRCLKAGAAGYLSKDRSPDRLAYAIRRVHQGGKYVTEDLADQLASGLDSAAVRPAHEGLSDREFQILSLIGAGLTGNEISARLALSPKTVSTYRSRILHKLGLRTTPDLVRYAVENGLVFSRPT